MIRNNKWKLIFTSALILLPVLFGLLFWDSLPSEMATHWGADGKANGFQSRTLAVFGMPLFLLFMHWVGIFITAADPKNKGQSRKVFGLIFWIMPLLSLFCSVITYSAALGATVLLPFFVFTFLGLTFIAVGNYMPKCKQNHTIGIKVSWTLASEENWSKTHRLAGKVWVIGGFLFIAAGFLPEKAIPFALFSPILLSLIPIVYSYLYHKKQLKDGAVSEADTAAYKKLRKWTVPFSVGAVILTLLLLYFVCFTGNITVEYAADTFTIRASYWEDLTLSYSDIDTIEFREIDTPGVRTFGYGSPRLLMGTFQNDEFGQYTRYSYTKCDSAVILTVDRKTVVLSASDEDGTKEIYDALKNRIG